MRLWVWVCVEGGELGLLAGRVWMGAGCRGVGLVLWE